MPLATSFLDVQGEPFMDQSFPKYDIEMKGKKAVYDKFHTFISWCILCFLRLLMLHMSGQLSYRHVKSTKCQILLCCSLNSRCSNKSDTPIVFGSSQNVQDLLTSMCMDCFNTGHPLSMSLMRVLLMPFFY